LRPPTLTKIASHPTLLVLNEGGFTVIDRGALLRRLLRFTGRIPTKYKLLYPFWQSAQLSLVTSTRYFDRLPVGLNNLSIAYAADIHYGPLFRQDRVIDLAKRLQEIQADIIILGGDYGEDTASSHAFFDVFPQLSAPLGVYAVMGNHDHMGSYVAYDHLLDAIRRSCITPLVNEAIRVQKAETRLCICSIDDIKQGQPDFEPLMDMAKEADFTIFAPHSPDAFPLALKQPGFSFDLGLAGHTHGGQLVILGHSLHSSSRYGDRYRSGWMRLENKDIMVTHGVGTSLLPIRIGAPAQIHHIILLRTKAD